MPTSAYHRLCTPKVLKHYGAETVTIQSRTKRCVSMQKHSYLNNLLRAGQTSQESDEAYEHAYVRVPTTLEGMLADDAERATLLRKLRCFSPCTGNNAYEQHFLRHERIVGMTLPEDSVHIICSSFVCDITGGTGDYLVRRVLDGK